MRKRSSLSLLFLVAALMASGCAPVCQPVFTSAPGRLAAVRVIAIAPFASPAAQPPRTFHMGRIETEPAAGDALAAKMSESLMASGRFKVVERAELIRVVRERDLAHTDLFDAGSAARLGKLLGADAVLVGQVQRAETLYRFDITCWRLTATVRLIDVRSAEVLMVANINRGYEVNHPSPGVPMATILDQETRAIAEHLSRQAGAAR